MRKSKSSLFLMELIIVVLFFALTSAVCLQVFVKAHSVDRETKNINQAIMWGDNLSELFYEFGSNTELILFESARDYTPFSDGNGLSILYLDNDYKLTSDSDNASFKISLSFEADDRFNYLNYSFDDFKTNTNVFNFIYKSNIQEVIE